MKGNNWFDHDYNARNDQRILMLRAEFGLEGYGAYWCIIETMAEDDGEIFREAIGGLSLAYGLPNSRLSDILDFCVKINLFKESEGVIFSDRIKDHKNQRKMFRQKGLEGAAKRWKNSPPKSPPNSDNRTLDKNIKKKNTSYSKKKEQKKIISFKTQTEDDFKNAIREAGPARGLNVDQMRNFFDYWSEPGTNGKMRYQYQQTWDLKRRMDTFLRNDSKYGFTKKDPKSEEYIV
jgi:hypothetical protein